MIRKKTITIEEQNYVWVAVLKHNASKIWKEYTDVQVFEDCEKARQWATKECHYILHNMVGKMGVMPYSSYVTWNGDNDLTMAILNKENQVQDQTDVIIYKKDIQ